MPESKVRDESRVIQEGKKCIFGYCTHKGINKLLFLQMAYLKEEFVSSRA